MLTMFEEILHIDHSSNRLRDELELFSSKYSTLEESNRYLSDRNRELALRLSQAQVEIARLNAIISSSGAASSSKSLNRMEEKILKYFFETRNSLIAEEVAKRFSINLNMAERYINHLLEAELLDSNEHMMNDIHFQINANGRAYVVQNM